MLQLAGIDTRIFSDHSIRGASTSEALRQGISITEILGMADWSQESTFSKFYYGPQLTLHQAGQFYQRSSLIVLL